MLTPAEDRFCTIIIILAALVFFLGGALAAVYMPPAKRQDQMCYVRDCWPVDHDNPKGYTLECDEPVKESCDAVLKNTRDNPHPPDRSVTTSSSDDLSNLKTKTWVLPNTEGCYEPVPCEKMYKDMKKKKGS